MGKVFAAAILSLFATGQAMAASTCVVPYIRTLDNQTVDGSMTVKTGSRCFIWLNHSGGPISSAHIVARPAHGSLNIDSTNRIVYQPRSGYTGSDSFTYARKGLDTRNNPITRTVRISVTVTSDNPR